MTVIGLIRLNSEDLVETGALTVEDASSEQPVPLAPAAETGHARWMPTAAAAGLREATVPTGRRAPTSRSSLTQSERDNGAGRFTFSSHSLTETGENRLQQSLDTLNGVVSSPDPAASEWLNAAIMLKRDAVRLRNSSQARHAAVLLTLADALTFTGPSEPTLDVGASRVLRQALALLTNPFISQEAEENLVIEMISLGWNLAPASSGQPLDH